jgi:RNA polymerase sigma-B factor
MTAGERAGASPAKSSRAEQSPRVEKPRREPPDVEMPDADEADAAMSRAEQRAAVARMFQEMSAHDPGSPARQAVRDAIVADHMDYARYVASRFKAPPGGVEDVVQVAYLALVKAVDNFDAEYGVPFIGYLTPMVTGEIKRHFRDTTWDLHVPRRMQELTLELRGAADVLSHALGRSPSVKELAEHLEARPEDVVEAMDASGAYSAASLDRPVSTGEEQGTPLGELLGGDDAGYDWVVDRETLKPLLAKLSDRDKRILLMRFFRNMTQSKIAEELGVSQIQVSRLLDRILTELRAAVG